jgi:hypothetical protein
MVKIPIMFDINKPVSIRYISRRINPSDTGLEWVIGLKNNNTTIPNNIKNGFMISRLKKIKVIQINATGPTNQYIFILL